MCTISSLLPRAGPRCLLALTVLALAGRLHADEPDVRDLQHEVIACQALHDDAALAKLSLIVKVRKRVATVEGDVPSRELAQRAVQCLMKLTDLIDVRDEMRVDNDNAFPSQSTAIAKVKKTFPSAGKLTNLATQRRKKETSPFLGVWQPVPAAASDQPIQSIALLRDISAAGPGSRPKDWLAKQRPESPDAAAIVSAVKNLVLDDERYRRMRFEVSQNKVYLNGVVHRWADLHELSRAIARIPGVEAVVFQDVRDEPRKQ